MNAPTREERFINDEDFLRFLHGGTPLEEPEQPATRTTVPADLPCAGRGPGERPCNGACWRARATCSPALRR